MRSTQGRRTLGLVLAAVVLGVAALGSVAALALLGGDGDRAVAEAPVTADVVSGGDALPRLERAGSDPAVGAKAPELAGIGFDGAPVNAPTDGQPTVLLFLAHWCPACQYEVPRVQEWIEAGRQRADVAFVAVSSGVDPDRDNYPPASWFEREGWTVPTLVDDENHSASRLYGLPGYPYWVFVTADGAVAGRHVGALGIEDLEALMDRLADLS